MAVDTHRGRSGLLVYNEQTLFDSKFQSEDFDLLAVQSPVRRPISHPQPNTNIVPLNPPLEYEVPLDHDLNQFGIGLVGAGFISRDCHIPAYLEAGFQVVGLTSRTTSRADEVAQLHHLSRVYATLDDLLADPQIQVIDVAVPPQAQPDVIRRIISNGKHVRGILAQKPLAMSLAEAREIVELCESAGITLAVNQNMRHDQSVRACRDLLSRGLLGDPVLATIDLRAIPHWMPWSELLHSLSTFVMSIHHIDTFRYWLGDPVRVLASTRPDPRTKFPHTDGLNLYIFEYENGARASSWDDVWTGPAREGTASEIGIRWRVEGTTGIARGTIGWPEYPKATPSTLDYSIQDGTNTWHTPRWSKVWFPDAFRGTMGELLMALKQNTEPPINGRDNLRTIALVEAVFNAAHEHKVVDFDEVLANL